MNWVTEPLQYPFMQRALLEMAIIGVLCGLIGCFVVLRGLAFIGDALAHAVFPGLVIAYVLGGNFLIGALIAAGRTVQVCFNFELNVPTRLPDEWRTLLQVGT